MRLERNYEYKKTLAPYYSRQPGQPEQHIALCRSQYKTRVCSLSGIRQNLILRIPEIIPKIEIVQDWSGDLMKYCLRVHRVSD